MNLAERLKHIINLRAERRMIPVKTTKAKGKKTAGKKCPAKKQVSVAEYLGKLSDEEKMALASKLLKMRK